MEFGNIEREIHVDASPEIVFEVISSPDHIRQWWRGAETDLAPAPNTTATIGWGSNVKALTVVEAQPPRLFSFRWNYDEEPATPANSLLVTFELEPSDAGTVVRLTESGFREKGWEAAVLEAEYADHVRGWDYVAPSLHAYVAQLVSAP